ncbi:alpha/beta hydrolase-fold protein [Lignipirellula cremea]|uniref:Esterase n=1 Tax=Lignipirellula cremea TaxID=2528010 RepID=A0A518E1D7_9BACT|nr:alpha/beta hydrolase-fold protein [Lignipirellula cremea]QDU97916.1 Putative esterase [Lignipirellula cremea]
MNAKVRTRFSGGGLLAISLLLAATGRADEAPVRADAARAGGLRSHTLTSPFQAEPVTVRVMLPEPYDPDVRLPVIYLLPVEPGEESRYGDPLQAIRSANLQQRYQAIFAAPSFSTWPWYADHPTDKTLQQESYFLQAVLPLIEQEYKVQANPAGRLLLGFSKSGWGAWSLLLRHPDMFHKAVAWDAPLMMKEVGSFGNRPVFGTQENFDKYRMDRLLPVAADKLGDEERLLLIGYGNFRTHHQQAHALLQELGVPHAYRDGPALKHHWESGWVAPAVGLLLDPPSAPRASSEPSPP